MKKEYEGNPNTGKIIIRANTGLLNPRLVEALNNIAVFTIIYSEYSTWTFTYHNFILAGETLHSYGYLPAIRD